MINDDFFEVACSNAGSSMSNSDLTISNLLIGSQPTPQLKIKYKIVRKGNRILAIHPITNKIVYSERI